MTRHPKLRRRIGCSADGMTLIELLVAMAIAAIMAAITLPTIKSVMTQRKGSQAALLVRNYLEAARARAIGLNRPVAVVLERISSRAMVNPSPDGSGSTPDNLISQTAINNPQSVDELLSNFLPYNACVRLTMADAAPSYTVSNCVVEHSVAAVPPELDPANDRYCRFVFIEVSDPRLAAIKVGDSLSFGAGAASRSFRVIAVAAGDHDGDGTPDMEVALDNFGTASSPFGKHKYSNGDPTNSTRTKMAINEALMPFEDISSIYSSPAGPSKTIDVTVTPLPDRPGITAVQPLELPRGTCIDLSLSGLERDNTSVALTTEVIEAVRRDMRRMFASDWSFSANPPASYDGSLHPTPADLRPIYLVFNTQGNLDRVICNAIPGFGASVPEAGLPILRSYQIFDPVYLAVGELEGVLPTLTVADLDEEMLEAQSLKSNLNTYTNQWVRVAPSSGDVSVASIVDWRDVPLADLQSDPTTPIGQVLQLTRAYSFTAPTTAQ